MSEPINDGGPAFPRTGADGHTSPQSGMSIRDYFAAKAMQGIISDASLPHSSKKDWGLVSCSAYEFADAMLKAREGLK